LVITGRKTRGPEDIELLRKIRSARPHLRLIILTDKWTPGDIISAMREGAFSYFVAPFEASVLAEMVHAAMAEPYWDDGIEVVMLVVMASVAQAGPNDTVTFRGTVVKTGAITFQSTVYKVAEVKLEIVNRPDSLDAANHPKEYHVYLSQDIFGFRWQKPHADLSEGATVTWYLQKGNSNTVQPAFVYYETEKGKRKTEEHALFDTWRPTKEAAAQQ